jgi:ADP-ribosylglycohydrolase
MLTGAPWVPELETEALPAATGVPGREDGWWPGCTTGTSTRVRRASATSSTAVRRCSGAGRHRQRGDAEGAYAEAIDLAGAHQSSYGREAAGVFAAAVAAAMTPGQRPRRRTSGAGTGPGRHSEGRRAVAAAVDGVTDWEQAIPLLRAAIEPYDTVGPDYRRPVDGRSAAEPDEGDRGTAGGPRLRARVRGGRTPGCLGGTNYGRDADSIASMAGAITGALSGLSGVPADWAADIAAASKTDLSSRAG